MARRYRGREDTSEPLRPLSLPFLDRLTHLDVSLRYFGRAKELPGVKELFSKKGASTPRALPVVSQS